MLWYIFGAIVFFITGYLVGANNPLESVKKKITQDAQNLVKKL